MSRDPKTGRYVFVRLIGDPDMGPDAASTLDGGEFAKPQLDAPKPKDYAEQMKRENARRRRLKLDKEPK